ncbi:MAG: bifunctional 3-deoxy-7-phosphoheptulonate synthase/chorismate mutase type II [Bacteroidales bacterium]|nr:bifunctional 3-deoxy-7-phosphoheptulonate synthase/chorismate mutase type II [Bacteroidales bacterium]
MERRLELTPVNEWGFFTLPKPMIIAGPCSAETEEQVMETAKGLSDLGIHVFRAGIWKPRTHPGSFEGVGVPGLKWMQKVKRELGMKICTEVACERHVFECIKHNVDMVWIGARTSANPFLMQEIADALQDTDIPVLVKNPVNPDIDLWIGALERLNRAGVHKLGVIHRGFSSNEKLKYRNAPGWNIAVEFRTRYPELPFFADPSHMGGSRDYILELSQRALDLGLDGLMIESHCNPSCALSDAAQQLTPAAVKDMLGKIVVRETYSESSDFKERLAQLRAQIDVLDENILYTLKQRMDVSRAIGQCKRENNVAIVQASRWDKVLESVISRGGEYGLSEDFVKAVFNAIHDASVAAQK